MKIYPGIKRNILVKVRQALVENPGAHSAEEYANITKISSTTARKYLKYMSMNEEAIPVENKKNYKLYEAI